MSLPLSAALPYFVPVVVEADQLVYGICERRGGNRVQGGVIDIPSSPDQFNTYVVEVLAFPPITSERPHVYVEIPDAYTMQNIGPTARPFGFLSDWALVSGTKVRWYNGIAVVGHIYTNWTFTMEAS